MDGVQDILAIAVSHAVGPRHSDQSSAQQISIAVSEKLVSFVVTAVLYEEIAEKTTRT